MSTEAEDKARAMATLMGVKIRISSPWNHMAVPDGYVFVLGDRHLAAVTFTTWGWAVRCLRAVRKG